MGKKNTHLLKYILVIVIVSGLFILYNNPGLLFLFIFSSLFFIPIIIQVNNNPRNPYTIFRFSLLFVFPVLLFCFLGLLLNCSNWFMVEFLVIVGILGALVNGKGMKFDSWFQAHYILMSLLVFVLLFTGANNGAYHAANNAKIKAIMSQMRSTAELIKIKEGSYADIGKGSDFNTYRGGINEVYGRQNIDNSCFIDRKNDYPKVQKIYNEALLIAIDGSAWCYKADLINDSVPWCVDSSGYYDYAGEGGCSVNNYSCKGSDIIY